MVNKFHRYSVVIKHDTTSRISLRSVAFFISVETLLAFNTISLDTSQSRYRYVELEIGHRLQFQCFRNSYTPILMIRPIILYISLIDIESFCQDAMFRVPLVSQADRVQSLIQIGIRNDSWASLTYSGNLNDQALRKIVCGIDSCH